MDDKALRENIGILVSRVLLAHLDFFKFTFEDVVELHQFYQETSEKYHEVNEQLVEHTVAMKIVDTCVDVNYNNMHPRKKSHDKQLNKNKSHVTQF